MSRSNTIKSDFEVWETPNPQNSQSFPEPRNAPTAPSNFDIQYSSGTMELVFNWDGSQDYSGATSTLIYKLTTSDVVNIETTSTTARISINEIGRDYQFSIQAFDKEGLGSEITAGAISIPGFIKSAFFYQDPRTGSSSPEYLIDLYYDSYPFIPPKYNSYLSGLVFYLNQENPPAPQFLNLGGIHGCLYSYATFPEAMKIYYPNYSFYQSSFGTIVILPNILNPIELYNQRYGGLPGGVYQYIINREQLEDNHLGISVRENFTSPPTPQDYFKVAFYSYTVDRSQCEQILVALDQTKYYFQESFPFNSQLPSPPTTPTNFQVVFQQESDNPYFIASWATSTDPDSLDWKINYQMDYWPENNPADKKQWIGQQNSVQIDVSFSGNYIFELKAFDEFNLNSGIVSTSSPAFVPVVLAGPTNCSSYNTISFGGGNSLGPNPIQKLAQSFEIINPAKISSLTVGLSNCVDCYNFSGAKISLRKSENNLPSEEILYSVSLAPNEIPRYYGFKNFSFFISSLIELEPGTYFLVIEPENSPTEGFWNLVSLYSGSSDCYQKGSLYTYYIFDPQTSRWTDYGRDTYFRVKGFFIE